MERRKFLKLLATAPFLNYGEFIFPVETEPILDAAFLMYHEVNYPSFKRDLLGFLERGYTPLSADALIDLFDSGLRPANRPFLFVTLDDGRESQYYQAARASDDILQETGVFVPLVFFVMTKFANFTGEMDQVSDETPSYDDGINRFMNERQIIDLIKRGHRVENHTVNHASLPGLSSGARNAEVEVEEERITSLWRIAGVERKNKLFAYPYGRYQGQVEYIKSLGYNLAFSTVRTARHTSQDRYILGRIGKS